MRNKYINFILESGLYTIYKAYRKYDYYYSILNYRCDHYDDIPIDYLPYISLKWYIDKYPRLVKYCDKLYASHSSKVRRVKKRFKTILYDYDTGELMPRLFLTLTFTDDALASTSQDTRRKYVRRFLKSQCDNYVANIDFGLKDGREHYHVLYGSDFVNPLLWEYGTCNIQHIRVNSKKLPQYINKLSCHSVKDTAGYLIYSRRKRSNRVE